LPQYVHVQFGREAFSNDFTQSASGQSQDIIMSFLLFLRGLAAALVVFGVATYLLTHSIWTTLIQTAMCAVLIQVGYFAAVLFMVWRKPRGENASAGSEGEAAPPKALLGQEGLGRKASVPNVNRSRQS
jgi:exopolysaccharide production repressor protein